VRILLDENLPVDLATELTGHRVFWKGIKNRPLVPVIVKALKAAQPGRLLKIAA
jgi:hypothetical protein